MSFALEKFKGKLLLDVMNVEVALCLVLNQILTFVHLIAVLL